MSLIADEAGDGRHGVQSIEIGFQVLRAVASGERPMMLKEIADAAAMAPSKVHRYLVSLIRAGMVEQDPLSSRYDLGPAALTVGLRAIERLDRVRLGLTAIAALRDEIQETTALSVWSEKGPVIIRDERPRRAITVNLVTGTALEMLRTASGRLFGAYLPRPRWEGLVSTELAQARPSPQGITSADQAEALFATVRKAGYACVDEDYLVPGVEAIGAPVFDADGTMVAALLVIGIHSMFDTSAQGTALPALRRTADDLTLRLGGRLGERPGSGGGV